VKYLKYLLPIALCLTCTDIFAGVFDVGPADKSKQFLGIIFGGSVGTISLGGNAINPILSKMFERFNFIVVMAGVLVVSYIGILSAVNTAREGEAMGKKLSLWVPLRALLGMLLMLPSPGTGYSVIQMTVMWIVLNGVGAANTIWTVVLDQLGTGVQAVGNIQINVDNDKLSGRNGLIENAFYASVCRDTLNNLPTLDLIQNYGKLGITVTIDSPQVSSTSMTQSAKVLVGVLNPPANKLYLSSICGVFDITTTIYPPTQGGLIAGASGPSWGQQAGSAIASSLGDSAASRLAGDTAQAAIDGAHVEEIARGTADTFDYTFGSTSTDNPANKQGAAKAVYAGGSFTEANLAKRLNIKINAVKAVFDTVNSGSTIIAQTGVADTRAGMSRGYVAAANAAYRAQIVNLLGVGVAPPRNQYSDNLQTLKSIGWIQAGGFYYAMTKATSTTLDQDAANMPTQNTGSSSRPDIIPTPMETFTPGLMKSALVQELPTEALQRKLNDNLLTTQKFCEEDRRTPLPTLPFMGTGDPGTGNRLVDDVVRGISEKIRTPIVEFFQNRLTQQADDPLVSIGKFGWQLMMGGEVAVFFMMIVSAGITLATSWGRCLSAMGYMTDMIFNQLIPLFFGLLLLLWTTGATLGVYIPLIPYLIFTATAIGWMIAVVEAVVGAPIIALALVQPGGEELGQIKSALGILANVFLRPTLMIFGFVIAGGLLRAILSMINFGFMSALDEGTQQRSTLFSIFPVIALYTYLIMGVVTQAFNLIFELPNKVLRYMGVPVEGGSPGELVKEAKGGFDEGTKTSQDAQKGMYDSGRKKMADKAGTGVTGHKTRAAASERKIAADADAAHRGSGDQ